ncbi:Gfo/Idh/MocA family oxidoreductase [Yinghuangia sp. ASG 101]|uniref:Gfo/Idh/MocA family oxidoreductase n=1 Tax=Yinghuangia sp. ASG 101 TaxID=2896848 RepID=UPI001E43DE94|nr:Gfo/Idh/MocA family oxidoreductase [Yinghuangia sp. ASG 101]UGQ12383.1 Gfo/Idh/MocA family oxidoreductase [Yinghuangia sp. ASG 101]
MTRARVLVCGANFGRFHAAAILARPEAYELAGVLTRGSAAGRAWAAELGVPFHTDPDTLPDGIDIACVAVGSAISGGGGTELAARLLARGIHVLQEHPLHLDEFTASLRLAREHGVQYRVASQYPHLAAVRRFVAAAERLRARRQVTFADLVGPVHLLHPALAVLGSALGGLRPWDVTAFPALPGHPFRVLQGQLAGVPLTVRVHHELNPADRDNHALLWPRVTLGTDGGVLTLADLHGPVLWHPRPHADRDDDGRFILHGPATGHLDLAPAATLAPAPHASFHDVFDRAWPEAIAVGLDALRAAAADGTDVLRAAQFDLTVCRIWSRTVGLLGPPTLVRPPRPRPLGAEALTGEEERGTQEAHAAPRAPAAAAPRTCASREPGMREGQDPPSPLDLMPARESAARKGGAPVGPAAPRASASWDERTGPCPSDSGPPRANASGGEHASRTPDHPVRAYESSAEFFDLVAGPHTASSSVPAVVAALAGADPGAGPVLDLGAGTGLLTEAVARAYPRLEIVAAEPAAAMRAALTARVLSDPGLRERVTVTDGNAPDLELPDRLGAVLLCGVLGHLDADARRRLWRRLARRLPAGAPVIVELMALDRPTTLPETRLARARIGDATYTWWFAGRPDADATHLTSRWTVDHGTTRIREVRDSHRWFPFGFDAVAHESGFPTEPLPHRPGGPPLALCRAPGPTAVPPPTPTTEDTP